MVNTTFSELRAKFWAKRWGLLPLRLMIGFGFAFHGYAKLARGVEKFAVVLTAIGVPLPGPMAWATALFELFGGIALMLGVLVIPFSLPLLVIILTAMIGVHLPLGFSSVGLRAITPTGPSFGPVGYEITLLYIAGLLTLVASGPSPGSLSALAKRWIARTRRASTPAP